MTKKVTTVKMRAQGNSDEDSNWAKARHSWVTQLLLRLRLHGFVKPLKTNSKKINQYQ
jgi:hypothetical protein